MTKKKQAKNNINLKKKNTMRHVIATLFGFLALCSCTDLVGTFKDFQGDGEIVYAGKVDSIKVHEGLHRIQFEGLLYYAAGAKEVVIEWDDQRYTHSLEGYSKTDKLEILLEDMEEDLYVFDIYTLDQEGNRSIVTTIQADVYGDRFIAAQNPVAYTYVPTVENCFMLTWSEVPELMEVRLEYTDVEGTQREIVVEPFTMQTEVANIRSGTSLKITTWIKPNEEALEYIPLEPVYEDFSA